MIAEAVQAAQEVVKQGSTVTVAIPTALISSIATILGREAIAAIIGRRKGKNGNGNGGPKPGEAKSCDEHQKAIEALKGKVTTLEANDANREKVWSDFRRENREDHQKIFDEIREQRA